MVTSSGRRDGEREGEGWDMLDKDCCVVSCPGGSAGRGEARGVAVVAQY